MKRILKMVLWAGIVGVVLTGISWIGARVTAGSLVGMNPPVSNRTIAFAFDGVRGVPGNPRAWVITYASSTLPGVTKAEIFVSLTGKILGTRPADLDRRLMRWENAKLPTELQDD